VSLGSVRPDGPGFHAQLCWGKPRIREWVNRASSKLRFPDWLREPQAAAQTLPPARHRTTVSHVDAPDHAVGAGHASDGRVRRDPADQARLRQLAEEQSALRRVAMLVARATPPEQVFEAVAEEVGGLLGVDYTVLIRSDPQDMITVVGGWTAADVALPSAVGSRFELGGRNVSTLT
jgi:hypothetical protein